MLRRMLDSIVAADYPAELNEIIVVENGSHLSEELVGSYAEALPISYQHHIVGNKSKALNTALAPLPKDALIVFFDDDIRIDQHVIQRFVELAGKFGPGHFFGGGLRADYEVQPPASILPYLPRSARDYDLAENIDHKKLPGYYEFLGPNWACFKSDLDTAGGFSPDFGPGSKSGARGQETDAQYRMVQNGCVAVAVGNAKVDHWVPQKFISEDWVVERIFLSSIHLGQEKSSLLKSIGLLVKLQFSLLQYLLGNKGIGPRYRIAKAAGYFKGLVSSTS